MPEDLFPPGISRQQSLGTGYLSADGPRGGSCSCLGAGAELLHLSRFGIQVCQQQWGQSSVTALCSELKDKDIFVFLYYFCIISALFLYYFCIISVFLTPAPPQTTGKTLENTEWWILFMPMANP